MATYTINSAEIRELANEVSKLIRYLNDFEKIESDGKKLSSLVSKYDSEKIKFYLNLTKECNDIPIPLFQEFATSLNNYADSIDYVNEITASFFPKNE